MTLPPDDTSDVGPSGTGPSGAGSGGGGSGAGSGDAGSAGSTPDGSGLVGSVLAGRYRILSLLGEGAMGFVYLGEHQRIGRRDAIKVLRPSMARDEEAIARFTRGARNASGIRHPNVCAIYDFGTTEEGLHFLAMEYVEGGALSDVLTREGPLPTRRAANILQQAAGALQVAHDRGIVHRDLKPDNIMLARDRDGADLVKVVDFDISLGPPDGEGARVTRHGYVVGTPEYMSPEQLTGDPLGPRSDIYSLALVFFRMLTGRLPFDAGTAQEVMVKRLTEEPMALADAAPDAGLPDALESVMRRAMARRAEDRPGSAAELAREVEGALGGRAPAPPDAAGGRPADAAVPSPADPEIPRTRVSSTADPAPADAGRPGAADASGGGARAGGSPLWSPRVLAGAAATVAVLALAGFGVVALTSDGGEGDAAPPPTAMTGEDGPGATDPDDGERPGATSSDDGEADPPSSQDPPGTGDDPQPERDAPERTETETGTDTESPPETGDASGAGPSAPAGPSIVLPDEEVRPVLTRQLLALGEDGADQATLRAARDTARAIWNGATMSREDSAYASFILAQTSIPLGDSIRGVEWAREAVRLDPSRSGFRTFLEAHRGGGR